MVLSLCLWFGGFTFYSLVVIPSGHQVLHNRMRQGFITQLVTDKLNLLGAVTLAIALAEVLAARSQAKRFRLLLCAWLTCVLCQIALFIIHGRMDALLDFTGLLILEEKRFEMLHLSYLWVATIGWLGGGLMLSLTASNEETPVVARRLLSVPRTLEINQ